MFLLRQEKEIKEKGCRLPDCWMQFQGARSGVSEREEDASDSSFYHFKFFFNYPYYLLGRV